MMVQGRVRTEWENQGWERGPMGYPVRDQQHMPPLRPTDHPNLGWCLFQNGALFSIAGAGATATVVDITPDQMRSKIRTFFDLALKAKDPQLGLEAQVDLVAVSDWSYGFWAAAPRSITFGLHGFRNNSDGLRQLVGSGGEVVLNFLAPFLGAIPGALPVTDEHGTPAYRHR